MHSMRDQRVGEHLGVGHHLTAVVTERGRERLLERDRLGGDHVFERPALRPREHRLVHGLRVRGLAEDQAAARTAQRFVCRRGDHVGERDRARIHAGRREPREVGHVDHEDRADLLGRIGELLIVEHA